MAQRSIPAGQGQDFSLLTGHVQNVGGLERWVSGIAGGLLVVAGLRRGGLGGTALALGGAALAGRGVGGYCPVTARLGAKPAERRVAEKLGWRTAAAVSRSVTIAKPVEEVYRFFRDFRNLPGFMEHVERIDVRDDTHSHWVVRAPFGPPVEWDALVTEDRPNESISWRSEEGADVRNTGTVEFLKAPGERGTEVRATIAYEPPAGQLGRALAKLWGEEPGKQAHDDLRRLKQLLETGEIPTPVLRAADRSSGTPDSA
ncbi:SRPBCC family protein [Roseomonas elaeocarpi]|uniref:SRPBCC family protein n=1 Tax=Roseomonas elaeocarpi TaxID=907779 RepID=A0ABV6JX06_9PROT